MRPTVERAERELLQPRPRPSGLVFLVGRLPLRPLPPSLFLRNYPPPFTQFQVFSTQLLAFVLPMCWVRQSHHASTSPPSTRFLTCACHPSIPPLLALGPTFSRRWCPNFATAGTVAARNIVYMDKLLQQEYDVFQTNFLSASNTSNVRSCVLAGYQFSDLGQ